LKAKEQVWEKKEKVQVGLRAKLEVMKSTEESAKERKLGWPEERVKQVRLVKLTTKPVAEKADNPRAKIEAEKR